MAIATAWIRFIACSFRTIEAEGTTSVRGEIPKIRPVLFAEVREFPCLADGVAW
jgi:hypothetical protein